ncbi:MAG: alpha/beta hydrolase [Weeksellaceae bacterium]
MKVYFISGLGANEKAFKRLKINKDFEPIYLNWKTPETLETFDHYVQRMAEDINVNEPFHLAGLSFGGILVQEMNDFLNPEKTILISTIRNREEMPSYMKLTSKVPLHKAIPMQFFTSDKVLSYAFFRKLYDPRLPKLNEFFTEKNPVYLKWSIDHIINWLPKNVEFNQLYRMHGDKDIVFPATMIKDADIVSGGTHIMVLQKSKEVSKLLNSYLIA